MKRFAFLFLTLFSVSFFGCTDLEEGIFDRQVADDFYATPEGINAALADIYNEIRGDFGGKGVAGADRGWFDMNEVSTDEMLIPTRSDGAWDDNGIWRQFYRHEWTPAQEFVNNTWNWLYRSVFKANLAVELLTDANAEESRIAEAKVLRAYFYYMLMDAYGDIPFYTQNNITVDQIPQADRATVYDFVVQELTENVDKLSEVKSGEFYGRFNKWAGYALLAKVYINAEVYTGTPRWTEAIAACDKIINEGGFSLVNGADYFTMFADDHRTGPSAQEVILAIFIDANTAPRNIIGIRSLRGAQGEALFGFSTWNGATVHRSFVDRYEDNDLRKAQWITGPQAGGVNYTLEISSLNNAGVEDGARNTKFLPVEPYNGGAASNDFPIYRYADILLMKAEAAFRLGQTGTALTLVNEIRARANATQLLSLTLNDIYDERGRELCWEGHRRQDMIRFGTFNAGRDFKPASDATRRIFPLPQSALDTNPNLVQNPGY
ncbi:MAG: RagB/SusD family nutrient uptake outer membrane protein [Microscillaceae bacterium]